MSPVNDTFLTTSFDMTMRQWDLRQASCHGLMRADKDSGRLCVEFDPLGLVFATASSPKTIKLFDVRNCDKGPFDTFTLDIDLRETFTHVKFSPDGKMMLLSTLAGRIYSLDAFNGHRLAKFTTTWKSSVVPFEASFSPDGRYVVAGSDSNSNAIHAWNSRTGDAVCTWEGHPSPPACVQWNPVRCSFVSACTRLAFWCPSADTK